MASYLKRLFFHKSNKSKAAQQGRLSKFKAIECSKIGHTRIYGLSTNSTTIVSTDPP